MDGATCSEEAGEGFEGIVVCEWVGELEARAVFALEQEFVDLETKLKWQFEEALAEAGVGFIDVASALVGDRLLLSHRARFW